MKNLKEERIETLPSIMEKIIILTEKYNLRVGQILDIISQRKNIDVFNIENKILNEELDKFIKNSKY